MIVNPMRLRSRSRWCRRWLRRRQQTLAPALRRRIVLVAFILLLVAYGWVLFRGKPELEIISIEFPNLKFR